MLYLCHELSSGIHELGPGTVYTVCDKLGSGIVLSLVLVIYTVYMY